MVRTLLGWSAAALAAVLLVPPLWFGVFPPPTPELPPPGRRVEVAPGVGVNLLETGAGPVAVLVHGHPGSAYDWQPTMVRLAALGHRVLAYDRVGYGHSDARKPPSTVGANAGELLSLLDREDLRDVTLVGWSYGGATSLAATRQAPSRIARLVLVGSVGPGIQNRPAPPAWVTALLAGPVLTWVGYVPPLSARLRSSITEAAFAPEPVQPAAAALIDANFAAPHTRDTFRNEGRDLDGRFDLDPSTIARPVLVIHGDGDLLVPLSVGETLHRLSPQSQLWVVEGGGHMLPITRPVALAERIARFASGS